MYICIILTLLSVTIYKKYMYYISCINIIIYIYLQERDADGNILLDKDGNPRRKKIGMIKKGKSKVSYILSDQICWYSDVLPPKL